MGEQLKADTTFEQKFLDLESHFDVTKLAAPSEETKIKLVEQLLDRPEVQGLGIQFQLRSDNQRDPRSQLIHSFINQVDQLATR